MSGAITLTSGQVLENFDLKGYVIAKGNNITIRCGRINSDADYAVTASRTGNEAFLLDGVELAGDPSGNVSAGLAPYGDWTARRLNVHGFKDGIKLGSDQTIADSWIHDQLKVPGAHNDGMQSVGGRNVKILHNNIEGPWQQSTSALILAAHTTPYLDNYVIEGNRLSGGTYTVYLGSDEGNSCPSGIIVRNNLWVSNSSVDGAIQPSRCGLGATVWTGNTYSNGTSFVRTDAKS